MSLSGNFVRACTLCPSVSLTCASIHNRHTPSLTHPPVCQATIEANDCRVACCDDANCQHWLFSTTDGCWLSRNPALTCIPNWADFGHWVGQRRKALNAYSGAGVGGGGKGGGGGEDEVGKLEKLLGLSASHVSEMMAQVDQGVFAGVRDELYSALVWRGNTDSWLQEVGCFSSLLSVSV
jgi:hypothetical protein